MPREGDGERRTTYVAAVRPLKGGDRWMTVATNPNDQNVRVFSGISALAGIWLIVSPWVLTYTNDAAATWDDVLFGVIFLVLAGLRVWNPALPAWISWLNVIAGAWILISPWVLGHSGLTAALWSEVVTGIVVIICSGLSAWAGSTVMTRPMGR
jgi:hypothetical protein